MKSARNPIGEGKRPMQDMDRPTLIDNALDNAHGNEFGPLKAGAWLHR